MPLRNSYSFQGVNENFEKWKHPGKLSWEGDANCILPLQAPKPFGPPLPKLAVFPLSPALLTLLETFPASLHADWAGYPANSTAGRRKFHPEANRPFAADKWAHVPEKLGHKWQATGWLSYLRCITPGRVYFWLPCNRFHLLIRGVSEDCSQLAREILQICWEMEVASATLFARLASEALGCVALITFMSPSLCCL